MAISGGDHRPLRVTDGLTASERERLDGRLGAVTSPPVVFDLFHTLVDTEHLRPTGFDAVEEMAAIIGAELADFRSFWADTYVERETTPIDLCDLVRRYGDLRSIRVSVEQHSAIAQVLGVVKDDALRHPEPSVVNMLAALRQQRALIGVLSNCHAREVRCWAESPLEALTDVFGRSCHIGVMKPDTATYAWVLARLEVSADGATYVGNGSSDELGGARAAGFARVIHCNVFDRRADQVSVAEQQRRAATADSSVNTIAELRALLIDAR